MRCANVFFLPTHTLTKSLDSEFPQKWVHSEMIWSITDVLLRNNISAAFVFLTTYLCITQ